MNLKKYTDNYYDFVYNIKKNAYKKYVEYYFGEWDEAKQQEFFKDFINNVKDNTFIIVNDNEDIGFYNGEDIDDDNYEIGNICIKEEYRGKGFGTELLKKIIEENKDKNLKLQYFKINPVEKLYKKLGFVKNGETKYHYQMIKRR